MPKSDLLPVKKFAKLLQLPESTIRHYSRIGLLPAAVRGENSYNYYSIKQASSVNVIRTLQKFGISLSTIKKILKQRDPSSIIKLLEQQMQVVDSNILKWSGAKNTLINIQNTIHQALDARADIIYLQAVEEKKIIRGKTNSYGNKIDDFDTMFEFYKYIKTNYPGVDCYSHVWGIFTQERVRKRDWKWPDNYYVYSQLGDDIIPKSLYAIGHTRCGYGQGGTLYEKMLQYIDENGFELCGDVYEEYPLNEFCHVNEQEYLMRLLMPVCKKQNQPVSVSCHDMQD